MSKNKFGLMIYVVHTRSASKTSKGRWDVYEEVYIKNGMKNNLASTASVILDCANMTVYKDRSNTGESRSFDEFIAYLAKNHQQVAEYKEMHDQFMSALAQMEEAREQQTPVDVEGTEA